MEKKKKKKIFNEVLCVKQPIQWRRMLVPPASPLLLSLFLHSFSLFAACSYLAGRWLATASSAASGWLAESSSIYSWLAGSILCGWP